MLTNLTIGQLVSIIVVLLLLSAFFSSAETALMAINRLKLKNDAKQLQAPLLAHRLLQTPDRRNGLTRIGNNFVNMLATAITTLLAIKIAGGRGIVHGTAV